MCTEKSGLNADFNDFQTKIRFCFKNTINTYLKLKNPPNTTRIYLYRNRSDAEIYISCTYILQLTNGQFKAMNRYIKHFLYSKKLTNYLKIVANNKKDRLKLTQGLSKRDSTQEEH